MKKPLAQLALLDVERDWEKEWHGMPEFVQEDMKPRRSLLLHFGTDGDMVKFGETIGQTISTGVKSIWFPEAEIGSAADKRYVTPGQEILPQFPIYIISKGRYADSLRQTNKALAKMGVRHFVIVEEQELAEYEKTIECATLLVLPDKYGEEYDPYDDPGDRWKNKIQRGAGPARNFAWDHSVEQGHKWHWVMDDNIRKFERLHYNLKTPTETGAIFRAMEDFCLRYENVALAGPHYDMFVPRKTCVPAYVKNRRVFSCLLIRNDIPFKWAGRQNEDVDLNLRVLKAGWCTILFNAMLQLKAPTQTMKGGCNDEIYARQGTLDKSEFLAKYHADVARVVWKFGRWHHHVDYDQFRKTVLLRKPDVDIPRGEINNYGMELQQFVEGKWGPSNWIEKQASYYASQEISHYQEQASGFEDDGESDRWDDAVDEVLVVDSVADEDDGLPEIPELFSQME